MSINRSEDYLRSLLNELRALPAETGWVEFKHNNQDPQEIGEYISALSNSAAVNEKYNNGFQYATISKIQSCKI